MATGNRGTTFTYTKVIESNAAGAQTKTVLYTCPAGRRASLILISSQFTGGGFANTWFIRRTGTGVSGNVDSQILTYGGQSVNTYQGAEGSATVDQNTIKSGASAANQLQVYLNEGDQLLFTTDATSFIRAFVREDLVA